MWVCLCLKYVHAAAVSYLQFTLLKYIHSILNPVTCTSKYTYGFLKMIWWGRLYVCLSAPEAINVCMCVCLPLRLLITSGVM